MTLPLSKEQIEAIQARAEKATPETTWGGKRWEPSYEEEGPGATPLWCVGINGVGHWPVGWIYREEDAEFIAHAKSDIPALCQQALRAIELEAEKEALAKLVYVPGLWRCAKCEFTLVQRTLYAQSGTVGPRDEPGDKCPNCNSPLWRVTERDDRHEMLKRSEEMFLERQTLQLELTTARNALEQEREMVKWLERKPAEMPCDFKCGYGKHGNKDECHCGFADWEASRPSPQVKE